MDAAGEKLIEATWKEIGHKIRPLGNTVYLRTDPPTEKIGSLYKPETSQDFYEGMPHYNMIGAIVLASGKEAQVKPGDRICFSRLYFARFKRMEDRSVVGYIKEPNIAGYLEGDFSEHIAPKWAKAV